MVLCFSGTGNSRAAAARIASALDLPLVELTGDLLLDPAASTLTAAGNRIVWVFPVYSWGVPPAVVSVLRRIAIAGAENATHHLVITCGDDAGMTASQWRRLIRERGWSAGSATSVIMPNTYVLMKGFDVDPKAVETAKLEKAPAMVDNAIRRIASGATDDDIVRGRFPRFKSGVIYPWFRRYAMSPRPFHSTDACISCGKCAHSCPCLNIEMKDGRPTWGDTCALCLRCYHICPVHAVAYGNATRDKGQYLHP